MATTKATSISISKLSAAAHDAAKTALAAAKLSHPVIDTGVLIDPHWIIGIIIRNPDLTHLPQYQQIATQLTDQISRVALNPQPLPPIAGAAVEKAAINPQPLPPKESAALYWHDHLIICGFRPVTADVLKTFAE